jgi:hypothetical protein
MTRLAVLAMLATALAAGGAAAAPPRAGVFVPGVSLGGLRLGATPAQVRAAWGTRFGRCRSCERPTWYYNYRPFTQQGAGVEFRNGRVAAIFTLWSPPGWRTREGLRIGDDALRIAALYGPLLRVDCGNSYARLLRRRGAVNAIYVVGERVWGFGLLSPSAPACR